LRDASAPARLSELQLVPRADREDLRRRLAKVLLILRRRALEDRAAAARALGADAI